VLRGTGIHEMRHAQQWIDMARVALGRGVKEGELGTKLGIHESAVKAAVEQGPLTLGKRGFEQAEEFYESVFGANRGYRVKILEELAKHRGQIREARESWSKVKDLQGRLAGLPQGSAERAALEKELKAAESEARGRQALIDRNKAARDANEKAYKDLPEERDAYDVEAEYEAMLQSKRAAEAAEAARQADEPIELDDADIIEVVE
jgi:hypothetical protein